jgi:hypothetical protein
MPEATNIVEKDHSERTCFDMMKVFVQVIGENKMCQWFVVTMCPCQPLNG